MHHPGLTENESAALCHDIHWGSDGYPVSKRRSQWWVDGHCGAGACPRPFRTKRQAVAQWEAYIRTLIERTGRNVLMRKVSGLGAKA